MLPAATQRALGDGREKARLVPACVPVFPPELISGSQLLPPQLRGPAPRPKRVTGAGHPAGVLPPGLEGPE